ncbi:DUF4440 domain-containing protein [Shinella sp. CPCC 100929]|uniref:DUF4440 domain-containing protein n=1 Tax=Shinella lacus TaxID=2654216 RepID=A0ABT1RBE0_9HYPH|nr:DUF4440 domain-containing protein [Shinella lacus]MCQ4632442.1 DUF4440 domain-containing protein [Shinella lacus]
MIGLTVPLDDIRALEEALHRPEVRCSREAVETLLAEGFVEFGSSGTIYRREETIALLAEEGDETDDGALEAGDYCLKPISGDAVLLTYRTCRTRRDGSQRHVLRSSIWKHDGHRWQMMFHQGTVARSAASGPDP